MTKKSYLRADLDHIAFDCKGDPLELVDFYVSVLGFEPHRVEEFKAGNAPFPSVRVSPATILDFFPPKEAAAPSPEGLLHGNHFCFSVEKDAYDSLRERLKEHGVDIIGPPVYRSVRGLSWSIKVKDPEDNVMEFRCYEVKPERG